MRDLLIKGDWLVAIKNAPEDIKKELFYRIIKYGSLEEDVIVGEEDWSISNAWKNIKGDIDRMKAAHENSISVGKNTGRKSAADPILVWKYCQDHPSANVDEVGNNLNLPRKNGKKGDFGYLYENQGWKNRKDKLWLENFSNNDSNIGIPILENVPKILEKNLENIPEIKNGNLENIPEDKMEIVKRLGF